jgi:hypothetical protein
MPRVRLSDPGPIADKDKPFRPATRSSTFFRETCSILSRAPAARSMFARQLRLERTIALLDRQTETRQSHRRLRVLELDPGCSSPTQARASSMSLLQAPNSHAGLSDVGTCGAIKALS